MATLRSTTPWSPYANSSRQTLRTKCSCSCRMARTRAATRRWMTAIRFVAVAAPSFSYILYCFTSSRGPRRRAGRDRWRARSGRTARHERASLVGVTGSSPVGSIRHSLVSYHLLNTAAVSSRWLRATRCGSRSSAAVATTRGNSKPGAAGTVELMGEERREQYPAGAGGLLQQFENIARLKREYLQSGNPVISMDTKKKEFIGNLYRAGLLTQGVIQTLDRLSELGEGGDVPHGMYDVRHNVGHMNLGTSHDTGGFACDSFERWWEGRDGRYPGRRRSCCSATAAAATHSHTCSRRTWNGWWIGSGSRSAWPLPAGLLEVQPDRNGCSRM